MRDSLARRSVIFLALSILFLVSLTVFESALVSLSPGAERLITFLILVLPAVVGGVLGVLSLVRKEGRTGLAITGIVLNTLFAAFHLMLVLFAG